MPVPVVNVSPVACSGCGRPADLSFQTGKGYLCVHCFTEAASTADETGHVQFSLTSDLMLPDDDPAAVEPAADPAPEA